MSERAPLMTTAAHRLSHALRPLFSVGRSVVRLTPRRLAPLAFALLLLPSVAQAHRRDFPFTYEWLQPRQGEKEIELHTFYSDRDHEFKQQIEFEYGVSDKFAVAPYLVFERESGENLKFHEWKLETRYQLGEYAPEKFLPGLYLEYAKPKDESGEIEAKLILSRYDEEGRNFSINLIAEKALEGGEPWEKEYSFAYAQPLGEKSPFWRGGFEFIHNITDKQINAGPVLGFQINNFMMTAGYAFPLNSRDNNKGQFRLLTEYEWF